MIGAGRDERSILEWGCAGAALEDESGDLGVVAPFPDGVLVGVIDGLGHGPEAAVAARVAAAILEARAGQPVSVLVQECHEALRKTRGAVMTLASFDARSATMTWVAVGNVEAILLRAPGSSQPRDAILTRGGVAGYQLPPLRVVSLGVSRGDTLILTSDGIRPAYASGLHIDDTPQAIAESILARYAKPSDDALVLVARYLGGTA